MASLYVNVETWYKWNYLKSRERLTDLQDECMVSGGRIGGKGNCWVQDGYVHMAIKMDNQPGLTLWQRKKKKKKLDRRK